MTHINCATDQPAGQSTPSASPSHLEVELTINESPAPGWSRLWSWLLAPPQPGNRPSVEDSHGNAGVNHDG